LATKLDVTAAVRVFWRPDADNVLHYYVFPEFWLPEDTVQSSRNSQYQGWANSGLFHLSPGSVTDYNDIGRYLMTDTRGYQCLGVGYDPWNCTQLAQTLSAEGIEMYEVVQGPKTLSEPMKFVEQLSMQNRIHFDGNPVFLWMLTNVTVKPDRNDNIYPRKERNENKIDGVFAMLSAFYIIMKRDIEHTWQDWQEDPEPVFI
jgi:phage terminase large subunit-like protein